MTDTKTLFVVNGGVVTDAHVFPTAATVSENGRSVIWAGNEIAAPDGATFVDQPGAGIGWLVQGSKLVAPPTPAQPSTVPSIISDRQFFEQLANDGDITEDEALAAVQTGTLPQKLSDAIASLPADQQFPAKMLICGATQFQRSNPMVSVLGKALGKDAAALDAIWTAAYAL